MTRDEANDILTLHKFGLGSFPQVTVNKALRITGDLIPNQARQAWDRMNEEGQPIRVWRAIRAAGNTEIA